MSETTSKPITNTQILDVLAEMSAWLLAGRCTGGPWARSAGGREVPEADPSATSVCLRAALSLVVGQEIDALYWEVDEVLSAELFQWKGSPFLAGWNDFEATDAEVQELLSRAAHSLSAK